MIPPLLGKIAPSGGLGDADSPADAPAATAESVLAAAAGFEDPLLECLALIVGLHGRPLSPEALRAALPVAGTSITPALFVRAVERAGFRARVVKRRLSALSHHVLPCVVTFHDGGAAVLLSIAPDETIQLQRPEAGGGIEVSTLASIADDYTGYVILTRPQLRLDIDRLEETVPRPRSWFWSTLIDNWWTYAQVGIAAVIINIIALISPLFVMTVYDRVVPNNAMETLWVLATGFAIVIGFDLVLKTLRAYFIDAAGKRVDVVVACRLFDQVLDMRLDSRPASAGGFANILREFESVRDFFTSATLVALIDLPFVALFLVVLWLIAGPLTLILLAAIPIVLIYGLILQWPLSRTVRRHFRESEQKHGVLVETIFGLETLKAVGAEARMRKLWESVVSLTAESSQRSRALSQSGINVAGWVQQMTAIAVVVFGVYRIAEGELTVGGLIACVMLGGRALQPLSQVAHLLTRVHQSMASLKALDRIMLTPVERPADAHFLHRPRIDGAIAFENVSFSYPQAAQPSLRDVSFAIHPGEHVGIIGRVGSGKTTIAKLILGLYRPSDGKTLIDGTDMAQIDPVDLRRNMGYVAQDPILFRGTVRDNITAAEPAAADAAILAAARLAGIDEFLNQTPVGYDLPVGERGEGLSGGQRQAITIARALLRRPSMLILDEPTSSMDSRSEDTLKSCLREYLAGRTLVLVTHRASLLSFVDRVIILDRGRVIADGPREVILKALASGAVAAPRER